MKYWIGDRLRHFRREKELKQSSLGSVAGMCQSDVSRMENGELDPGFHSVMDMLQFMGRKLSDVVDDEGRPVPEREWPAPRGGPGDAVREGDPRRPGM